MKDSEVYVVGGANSAGQAAVHLARYAAQVTVLIRGRSLADSMSEYLIREIDSAPNIVVRHRVAVTGGAGQSRLESLTLTDLESGAAETVDAVALFVLIGAEPRTQWLPDAVRRDDGSTASTSSGQRANSDFNALRPSIRASWWPRQKWIPVPKAMWRFGFRCRSSRSGWGLACGSMLAAASMTMTFSPFGSLTPPSSTSLRM